MEILTSRQISLIISGLFLLCHMTKKPEHQIELERLMDTINKLPIAS